MPYFPSSNAAAALVALNGLSRSMARAPGVAAAERPDLSAVLALELDLGMSPDNTLTWVIGVAFAVALSAVVGLYVHRLVNLSVVAYWLASGAAGLAWAVRIRRRKAEALADAYRVRLGAMDVRLLEAAVESSDLWPETRERIAQHLRPRRACGGVVSCGRSLLTDGTLCARIAGTDSESS